MAGSRMALLGRALLAAGQFLLQELRSLIAKLNVPTAAAPSPKGATVSRTVLDVLTTDNFEMQGKDGGIVHKLTPSQRQEIADAIADACKATPRLPVAIYLAAGRSESIFDPLAVNPNNQNMPKGGWPATPAGKAAQIANTDYGFAQVHGDPTYLGYGLGLRLSLTYIRNTYQEHLALAAVGGYPVEVAYEAYNSGWSKAVEMYEKGGVQALEYGRLVAARIAEYRDVV